MARCRLCSGPFLFVLGEVGLKKQLEMLIELQKLDLAQEALRLDVEKRREKVEADTDMLLDLEQTLTRQTESLEETRKLLENKKDELEEAKKGQEHARYDFQFVDQDGYHITIEGLSRMFQKEYWNYAKLISGILRHGMPIPNVVELIGKLTFDVDSITTWSNGVARALKRYIQDGTETDELCPDCGSKIVYRDGCKSCQNCGWSKCS